MCRDAVSSLNARHKRERERRTVTIMLAKVNIAGQRIVCSSFVAAHAYCVLVTDWAASVPTCERESILGPTEDAFGAPYFFIDINDVVDIQRTVSIHQQSVRTQTRLSL